MAKVPTSTQTEQPIPANGVTNRCMARASTAGQMENTTKDATPKTTKTDLASSVSQTGEATMENGKTDCSQERGSSTNRQEGRLKESGPKESFNSWFQAMLLSLARSRAVQYKQRCGLTKAIERRGLTYAMYV
jgi:hypothetical protein